MTSWRSLQELEGGACRSSRRLTVLALAASVIIVFLSAYGLFRASCTLGWRCTVPVPSSQSTPRTVDMAWIFDRGISNVAREQVRQNVRYVWGAAQPSVDGTVRHDLYLPWSRGAGLTASMSWLRTNHPDWILYQANGKTPAMKPGSQDPTLDFTNPAVQQYYLSTFILPALRKGYSGVAWDNGLSFNKYRAVGHYTLDHTWVRLYSGQYSDPAWTAAQVAAMAQFRQAMVAVEPGAEVALNQGFNCIGSLALWSQPLPYVNVLLDEGAYTVDRSRIGGFFTTSPYKSCTNSWLQKTDAYVRLQSQGVAIVLVNEVPESGFALDDLLQRHRSG